MKKMKFVVALLLVALLSACAAPVGVPPAVAPVVDAPDVGAPAVVEATPEVTQEADETPVATSWAEEHLFVERTLDELLELAQEEGTLTIYTISSRTANVVETFMERFPGVSAQAIDLRSNEAIERFEREFNAGLRNMDIMQIQDLDGSMWFEFVMQGKLHIYYPAEIMAAGAIAPEHMVNGMPFIIELQQWFYNTEEFPDGAPISSWWDLTRPEWAGRIMIRDPLADIANLATLVRFSDKMAEDYERIFGEPITLHPDSPTVGHEFLRRFSANDLIFTASGGEIITAVGTPGQTTNTPIGYAMSSGLRRREERGYTLNYINITPATGFPFTSFLYIAEEAPNPNTARLFVYWMLGGADGQGVGFDPWNTLGGWPVRDDIAPVEGSTPLSEINLFPHDVDFLYFNILDIHDFWLSLQ